MNADQLRALASQPMPADAATAKCACQPLQTPSWDSITDERWPASVQRVGTLRAEGVDEPTVEEFHPEGTRYDSPHAPIAPDWFPFNRSDVYACQHCRRVFLRYTEYGGYYVDHRVRMVDAALIV